QPLARAAAMDHRCRRHRVADPPPLEAARARGALADDRAAAEGRVATVQEPAPARAGRAGRAARQVRRPRARQGRDDRAGAAAWGRSERRVRGAPHPQVSSRDELLREYLAAWNACDAERIASFFTEDAVYEDRGAGVVARGREEIRSHAAEVHRGFPDLRFELVRAAHGDDFTAGEWRA